MRLPITGIIIMSLLALLIDFINWRNLKSGHRPRSAKGYLWASLPCYLLLIATISLPRRNSGADITPLMWLLYTWITIYAGKTVMAVFSLAGMIPALFRRPQIPLGVWIGLPLGILLCAWMWWGAAVTRHQIEVQRVTVTSDRLPDSFSGFTIAQISDLHVGTWGNDTTFVSALVDSVNSLHPDIIVFTGDLVNRQTSEAEPFQNVLDRLKALMGVYSILGNHDYGDYITWKSPADKVRNLTAMHALQRSVGWQLLDNSHTVLRNGPDSIILIGVGNWGEPPFKVYGDLGKAYGKAPGRSLKDNNFKILLTHNPAHWDGEVLPKTNIDLSLSGHTHAMQMELRAGSLRWSPAEWKYARWGGLYTTGKQRLYVNIGDGEVAMPARLGAAVPEITFITLKK